MAEQKKPAGYFYSHRIACERAARVLLENGIRMGVNAISDVLKTRSRHDPERLRWFPCSEFTWGGKVNLKIVYFEPNASDFDELVIKAAKKYAEENDRTVLLTASDVKMPDEMED